MCEVCNGLTVNSFLIERFVTRYELKERAMPGFLASDADPDEVDEVLELVHYGNTGHAFFSASGVKSYRDLVDRMQELAQIPATYVH
ncbi:MAG: hypothetical protein FJY97_03765 [candidate division Zixibacteria bacterium]|nr:hypothetical protein [candidate division Zixibacteria bacterium]